MTTIFAVQRMLGFDNICSGLFRAWLTRLARQGKRFIIVGKKIGYTTGMSQYRLDNPELSAVNHIAKYRVKFSFAVLMAVLFLIFTVGSIGAGFSAESSQSTPGLSVVTIGLYLFYISRVIKDDSGAKILQLTIATAAGIATVASFIIFGGVAIAVVGVGLFGVLGGYHIWINLIARRPIVQADRQKLLLHNGFFRGTNFEVPWDNVEDLSIRSQSIYGGSRMRYLVIKLKDIDAFKKQYESKALSKTMHMTEKMYGGQLAVDVGHLEVKPDELLVELKKRMGS